MNQKEFIRALKTSPFLAPLLALIDLFLVAVDCMAVISAGRVQRRPNSLLILRVDVLGDYLVFRNYLGAIRQSSRYQNHTITLCANQAIKSVAERFDSDIIDAFIWTDIYKLSTRPLYRFRFVRELRKQGFSIVFCPTYSRVLVLDDFMAWASGAMERVGCRTDYVNIKHWEAWLGDRCYTRLIESGPGLVFETERNRRIVEAFLGSSLATQNLHLDVTKAKPVAIPSRYIVFSLGAGQEFRVWPAERFAKIASFISRNYSGYELVLTGAPNEVIYANEFLKHFTDTMSLIDLTGKISIPELIYVLSKATLLLANETGIVHMAASTSTPTIVISQGKSLVRWHPYPADTASHIHYLYPSYIEERRSGLSAIAGEFNPESRFCIEEITVERVQQQIAALLPNQH